MNASLMLNVLASLDANPGTLRAEDLAERHHTSRATMFRLLRRLEVDFGVTLAIGQAGGYVVRDWGVFRRQRVIEAAPPR